MAQDGDSAHSAPPAAQGDSGQPTTPHATAQIALADGTTATPGSPHPTDKQDGNGNDATAAGDAASPGMKNSKGWDGKLRLPKKATVQLANPEALSDPEYSDDENVVPGEEIAADEDLLNDEDPDTDEIVCTHSRVHDIGALHLERFRRCQRLCLRQNSIQKIDAEDDDSGLAALASSLKELDLYDNLVAHMRGVQALPKLTSLDLSFNKIRHIKHLENLTELQDLYLVANKIAHIEGLQGLPLARTLRMLELGSNRIREIRGLDGLDALEELWLAKNKITSLEGLSGLPKLRLLSVQANRIRDLAPLRNVHTLEELYVSHNALASLESLAAPEEAAEEEAAEEAAEEEEGETEKEKAGGDDGAAAPALPRLRVLDVGNNQLTSLRGVEALAQLEEVWAGYNQLADFADVQRALGDKKALDTVYLEGNPLQLRAPALYRNKVRLAVPQVTQIDATYVREI